MWIDGFNQIITCETALNGGMTWQPRPNVQLDVSGGFGLSDAAPDWFAGVGVSVRLPR